MPGRPVRVELNSTEITIAGINGVFRQVRNIKKGCPDANGFRGFPWQVHSEGCLGELALGKFLNRYWLGGDADKTAPDVSQCDVRTRSRQGYELILHKKDHDNRPYVLAIGSNGIYTLVGWCWGRDGKNQAWYDDRATKGRFAYWVPIERLEDMLELPAVNAELEAKAEAANPHRVGILVVPDADVGFAPFAVATCLVAPTP